MKEWGECLHESTQNRLLVTGTKICTVGPITMVHQQVRGSGIERQIDTRIMAFQRTRRRMMFSDLAESLPNYTWHMLFSSLGRLRRDHHVELVAHQWDYEVIFLRSPQNPITPTPVQRR